MKKIMLLLIGVLLCANVVFAAIPEQISFQGQITGIANPQTNVPLIVIDIYDVPTGGTRIWHRDYSTQAPLQNLVISSNGLFNCMLSDFGTLDFSRPYYVEVIIADNAGNVYTMSPRQPLTSAPYSITSKNLTGGYVESTSALTKPTSNTLAALNPAAAIHGSNTAADGYAVGVYGENTSVDGAGVFGKSPNAGVSGYSTGTGNAVLKGGIAGLGGNNAYGVAGRKLANSSDALAAVYGTNERTTAGENAGVKGVSVSGYGVVGAGGQGSALLTGDVRIEQGDIILDAGAGIDIGGTRIIDGGIIINGAQIDLGGGVSTVVPNPLDLSNSVDGAGAVIKGTNTGSGYGLYGLSDSGKAGVFGDSAGTVGVYGYSESADINNGGVKGEGRVQGVYGIVTGYSGQPEVYAVKGKVGPLPSDGATIKKISVAGFTPGTSGVPADATRVGVLGKASDADGIAVYGVAASNARAAKFEGNVDVAGNINITGGQVLVDGMAVGSQIDVPLALSGKQVSNNPLNPGYIILGDNQSQGVLNSKHGTGIYGNSQALNGAGVFGKGVNVGVSGYSTGQGEGGAYMAGVAGMAVNGAIGVIGVGDPIGGYFENAIKFKSVNESNIGTAADNRGVIYFDNGLTTPDNPFPSMFYFSNGNEWIPMGGTEVKPPLVLESGSDVTLTAKNLKLEAMNTAQDNTSILAENRFTGYPIYAHKTNETLDSHPAIYALNEMPPSAFSVGDPNYRAPGSGIVGESVNGYGIEGKSANSTGVVGSGKTGGVLGFSSTANAPGVLGQNTAVHGIGLMGLSAGGAAPENFGNIGVYAGSNNFGVFADGTIAVRARGLETGGHFSASNTNSYAVKAVGRGGSDSTGSGGVGLFASGVDYAAIFKGKVKVDGDLEITGDISGGGLGATGEPAPIPQDLSISNLTVSGNTIVEDITVNGNIYGVKNFALSGLTAHIITFDYQLNGTSDATINAGAANLKSVNATGAISAQSFETSGNVSCVELQASSLITGQELTVTNDVNSRSIIAASDSQQRAAIRGTNSFGGYAGLFNGAVDVNGALTADTITTGNMTANGIAATETGLQVTGDLLVTKNARIDDDLSAADVTANNIYLNPGGKVTLRQWTGVGAYSFSSIEIPLSSGANLVTDSNGLPYVNYVVPSGGPTSVTLRVPLHLPQGVKLSGYSVKYTGTYVPTYVLYAVDISKASPTRDSNLPGFPAVDNNKYYYYIEINMPAGGKVYGGSVSYTYSDLTQR